MRSILKSAEMIAVIGASSRPSRTSNKIFKYLKDHDFDLIPVNPNEDEVHGENAIESIRDLPEDKSVDIAVIFRNKKYTADMVEDIVEWAGDKSHKPLIWTQIGVSSEEAEQMARENGFDYVKNECIMVEHRNLG